MSEFEFVTSWGEKIPIVINVRRGLRNITLRPHSGDSRHISISRPWLSSNTAAMKFVEQKRRWLEKFFINAPQKVRIKSGDTIEFLDRRVGIVYDGTIHANNFVLNNNGTYTLFVGGDEKMLESRVRNFVKAELLKEIKKLIRGVPRDFWPRRICLRDTTSRWGSCSSTGTMSFSWRLAFAPYDVMRYVVMHELSHVKHMDHSPEFWAQVRALYGFGVERAKRWLNQNGSKLHQYL
ncbi:MAG: DUF45 domain-containing protein [Alphaproteobacteria bacterium]|nr:DUF45 domain-containing protein [Alphaproteobacteria bacterium]